MEIFSIFLMQTRTIRNPFDVFFLYFFSCGGCDTLFPSLMLLEHHKEEYEHWSDSEEYQRPCCRRNRRDDFDYTESDSCSSEAESEDMERLL